MLNVTCKYGYEYTDPVALDAIANGDPNDDYLLTVRQKECREVAVPQGGTWRDVHVQPDKCYRKQKAQSIL